MGMARFLVEYADLQGAVKAKSSLHGRKLGGNTIVATYYPEEKFMHGDFGG
jgi:splicing factor U2AF subunit